MAIQALKYSIPNNQSYLMVFSQIKEAAAALEIDEKRRLAAMADLN